MSIHGDNQSREAKSISMVIQKCMGHDYCKSPEEIKKFFTGKYLIMMNNQIRFDTSNYG